MHYHWKLTLSCAKTVQNFKKTQQYSEIMPRNYDIIRLQTTWCTCDIQFVNYGMLYVCFLWFLFCFLFNSLPPCTHHCFKIELIVNWLKIDSSLKGLQSINSDVKMLTRCTPCLFTITEGHINPCLPFIMQSGQQVIPLLAINTELT